MPAQDWSRGQSNLDEPFGLQNGPLFRTDNGEQFVVELSNSTLTNLAGFRAGAADLTLTVNREDLEQAMTGAETLQQLIADGRAQLDGDAIVLQQRAASMVHFELGFELMPGTGHAHLSPPMEDFEAEPLVTAPPDEPADGMSQGSLLGPCVRGADRLRPPEAHSCRGCSIPEL